jgi:Xaa-Pro aminopeptidase
MNHKQRMRQLQSALLKSKLDYLLITHLPNILYVTGFTGSSAALLVGDGEAGEREAVLFTDGRYRTQARQEVNNARIVIGSKAPALAAAEWLASQRSRGRILGIESEWLSVGARDRLSAALRGKGGKARLRSAPPLVERARMVKDAEELSRIRAAAKLGASLFAVACKAIRPGAREVEVAAAMEFEARRNGAEGMSFPTIIAAGKRSAVIHGRASLARIPSRGFVVCDFGVILAGYCSDRTRTVYVGKPSQEARDFYGAVLEAQQAAIAAVRPGVTTGEVDEAARSVLRKWRLARWFTHSTGHGVGLEIHEAPRVAAGQTQALDPGMVITIEPGAYVPGKWGVRIEDIVVVTSSGCEVLSPEDKGLVVL